MPPPNPATLQQPHLPDKSSPNFHDQLSDVLSCEEYKRSAQNLRGNAIVSLVDYLDGVRCRTVPPRFPLKLA